MNLRAVGAETGGGFEFAQGGGVVGLLECGAAVERVGVDGVGREHQAAFCPHDGVGGMVLAQSDGGEPDKGKIAGGREREPAGPGMASRKRATQPAQRGAEAFERGPKRSKGMDSDFIPL